jgi:pyruvate kinase
MLTPASKLASSRNSSKSKRYRYKSMSFYKKSINTKIICTIGPACDSDERLAQLIKAGLNVARLNFSHGTHDEHLQRITRIRRIAQTLGVPVAILQDLQGPKIRIGTFAEGGVQLDTGVEFTITTASVVGDQQRVSTVYKGIVGDVKPGDVLLLDDGKIRLEVLSVAGQDVLTKVRIGGFLKDKKGINLPNVRVSIPPLTEKDIADLAFGLEHQVDYVAVSFVQSAEDIALTRATMQRLNPSQAQTPIIAKLEKPEVLASTTLNEIIAVSDGVMVARGDLGVELGPHKVPAAQKRIIRAANRRGKIVITATQMLESMIDNPMPTRAEASDVANAIFDGTDAIMLSGETASGKYPIEAVEMMNSIAIDAEKNMQWGSFVSEAANIEILNSAVVLARATKALSENHAVKAIAVFTRTGTTARIISKERPTVPILAFTAQIDTYRRMSLLWGVRPFLIARTSSLEEMIRIVENSLLYLKDLQQGDQVSILTGLPLSYASPANIVMLHTIGSSSDLTDWVL